MYMHTSEVHKERHSVWILYDVKLDQGRPC